MNKYVVLLSAGLDSTVNLYSAHADGQVVLALNFDYGQRAAQAEKRQAQKMAQALNIPFRSLNLDFFKDFSKSSLTNTNLELAKNMAIDNLEASKVSAKNVWVANRNGIFLNIAAAYAESLGAQFIVPGFNKEEAATFPDNSADYLNAASKSLSYSTSNQVQLKCFTLDMDKSQIVGLAKQLKVDFDLIWPCYQGLDKICGECESCLRYLRALSAHQIKGNF